MKIEIDQSGKIEFTAVQTVVADSLDNVIKIKGKEKRIIQKMYREKGKPKLYLLETFSFITACLIKESLSRANYYVIDVEYPGHNDIIKRYILLFARKLKIRIDTLNITFNHIGKKIRSTYVCF